MQIFRLTHLPTGDVMGHFHFYEHAVQSVQLAYPGVELQRSPNVVCLIDGDASHDFAIETLKVHDEPYDFNWLKHIGRKAES